MTMGIGESHVSGSIENPSATASARAVGSWTSEYRMDDGRFFMLPFTGPGRQPARVSSATSS